MTTVAALVQHAGIPNAPPSSESPTAPVRTFAAIAGAPVPATGAVAATEGSVAMEDAAAGASAAAGSSWHEQLTPANVDGSTHTVAPPSAETDMDDVSMPAPADAPVSMRTRASLAIEIMLPTASGTLQGTVEGPSPWRLRRATMLTLRTSETAHTTQRRTRVMARRLSACSSTTRTMMTTW